METRTPLLAAAELVVAGLQRAQFNDADSFVRHVAARTLDLALSMLAGADVNRNALDPRSAQVLSDLAAFVRTCGLDELDGAYTQLLGCEPRVELSSGRMRLVPKRGNARRALGAWYTPDAIVKHLTTVALGPIIEAARNEDDGESALLAIRILDPSSGSGRFLIESARQLSDALVAVRASLLERDLLRAEVVAARLAVVERCVFGCDIDPAAAALCRFALLAFVSEEERAGGAKVDAIDLRNTLQTLAAAPDILERVQARLYRQIRVDDALLGDAVDPEFAPADGFDLIIGNPPFLSQLAARTSRDRKRSAAMRDRFGDAAKGYVDTAGLFFLLALSRVRPIGGRVALLQPSSLLSTAHAARLRTELIREARLTWIWLTDEPLFDASVRTTAIVLEKTDDISDDTKLNIERCVNAVFDPLEPMQITMRELRRSATWAHLVSDGMGVPNIDLLTDQVLGDVGDAGADFRDQYYGLVGTVVEEAKVSDRMAVEGERRFPKLVTSGLIDPHRLLWGERVTTFSKERFECPRVDAALLDGSPRLSAWLETRLVPKILLATQTRVLEAIVDEEGVLLPSVPVISVGSEPDRLWHLIAVLHTPAVSVWAARRVLGSAMSLSALKLSAAQVRSLPVPKQSDAWDEGAELNKQASKEVDDKARFELLERAGAVMHRAFDLDIGSSDAATQWWRDRLA